MKKVQVLITTLIVACVTLFGFKASTTATKYGGSGSARISIYKLQATPTGTVRSDKVSSSTINVTVGCYKESDAAAREDIRSQIESEARSKTKVLQEWDYDSEITFRITSCN
jgi:hypothetical protein